MNDAVTLKQSRLSYWIDCHCCKSGSQHTTLRSHSGSSLYAVVKPRLRFQHFTSPLQYLGRPKIDEESSFPAVAISILNCIQLHARRLIARSTYCLPPFSQSSAQKDKTLLSRGGPLRGSPSLSEEPLPSFPSGMTQCQRSVPS